MFQCSLLSRLSVTKTQFSSFAIVKKKKEMLALSVIDLHSASNMPELSFVLNNGDMSEPCQEL